MGRRPIKQKPMTPTEYQRRWRAKKQRQEKGAEKRQRRETRIAAMAFRTEQARLSLEVMAAIYNIIVIDFPWPFEVRSQLIGLDRSHENHYPDMTLPEIEAFGSLIPAAPDCVLCLWVTVPMMPHPGSLGL